MTDEPNNGGGILPPENIEHSFDALIKRVEALNSTGGGLVSALATRVRWLRAVVGVALLVGALAVGGVVGASIAIDRADDAIDADHRQDRAGCARNNQLRTDIQSIGTAADHRDDQLIAAFRAAAGAESSPAATRFFAAMDAANVEFEKALQNIKQIDCAKVFPKP